jgi:site-specific DNA-methyltransferase (adenine-specific)
MIVNKQLAKSKGVDNKDLWETPLNIFKSLDAEFNFTLDPCCEKHTAKCKKYYTPKENGLIKSWESESCFVNPPYSRNNIDLWVEKCFLESQKDNTTVVALLPVSTSAKWWHSWIVGKSELRFIERRIRFKGGKFTAPFSSVVAVFGYTGIRSMNQIKSY